MNTKRLTLVPPSAPCLLKTLDIEYRFADKIPPPSNSTHDKWRKMMFGKGDATFVSGSYVKLPLSKPYVYGVINYFLTEVFGWPCYVLFPSRIYVFSVLSEVNFGVNPLVCFSTKISFKHTLDERSTMLTRWEFQLREDQHIVE